MRLEEASAMIGIPGANTVVQTALGQGIHFLEPIEISGNLPVAKHFHDAAQLAVGGGVKIVFYRSFRKRGAERDVAVFVHGAAQLQFGEGGLEIWVTVREGLGIIPYVRARTMAPASIGGTSFPTPEIAAF